MIYDRNNNVVEIFLQISDGDLEGGLVYICSHCDDLSFACWKVVPSRQRIAYHIGTGEGIWCFRFCKSHCKKNGVLLSSASAFKRLNMHYLSTDLTYPIFTWLALARYILFWLRWNLCSYQCISLTPMSTECQSRCLRKDFGELRMFLNGFPIRMK